ncbi:DUF418 domain-containing protein [Pararhizobium sp. PWRC1-1]|uniref:DUF418 domain-containing protein n=1 Tax=Pararhizobium sp. PWRC1-1 TaxID=2804566 RepID=UPI003CF86076
MLHQTISEERILDVDSVRGFALFGILTVNICAFLSPFYGASVADPFFTSELDMAVRFLVAFLFEMKFYLLFSFLFGYSFTLQMQSAEKAGAAFLPRILRRQAGLWTIGLLHAVLLFHGDILTTYAFLGALLLAFRQTPEAKVLRLAKGLIVATALLWASLGLTQILVPSAIDLSTSFRDAARVMAAYRETPATVIAQHLRDLSEIWIVIGVMQAPCAFAMFLAGMAAGKRRMLADFKTYAPFYRRMLRIGLLVGLPASALYAYGAVYLVGSGWDVLGLALGILLGPFLTAGYLAAAMMLFQRKAGETLAAALAPAGRMALSNYLLQSVICAALFHAYGFRLMGQWPPLAGLLAALGIFMLQLALSRWWMARFAYGPLEWGLRAITIAAWPKWRKTKAI